ncbi:hypothetical protein TraAM80_02733 [Trypanosoma rangeli]|uniref:Uncharacterized protein n=1 Tax=Trypanosoma rangeli TaxID=5698 RepID=A0A422NSJ0_TRYRA|nr:uncharacterized protein TraAM80_02733 [Trypanosoma rangeli]RNF08433.1 hypothetical protein TraAM80_02733 [Trypanosoma rangeli]|eukprot:RNF08433.1 hypothetical protein TraAM80_02733 [Trypanosoma rangeli]
MWKAPPPPGAIFAPQPSAPAETSVSTTSYTESSYSYSYTETDSPTETEKETAKIVLQTGQQLLPTRPDLPPRVPQIPRRPIPPQVTQVRSSETARGKSTNTVSASSDSYGDSEEYSYSYSYSDEEDEASNGDSYSVSSDGYSYSTVSTKRGKYKTIRDERWNKNEVVRPVESSSSYTYSGSPLTGDGRDVDSTTHISSYGGSTSGSYSSSYSYSGVTGSRDSNSSSITGSTTSQTPTSGTTGGSQTITGSSTGTESSSARDRRKVVGSDGSQSYSYSYTGEEMEELSPIQRQAFSSTTTLEEDESKLTRSTTQAGEGSSSGSSRLKPAKVHAPPQYHGVGEATQTTESTTSLITGSSTNSLLKTSSELDHADATSTYSVEKDILSERTGLNDVPQSMLLTQIREVVLLTTPPEEAPQFRDLPHACLVPRGSANDTLLHFLEQLLEVQRNSLQREAWNKKTASDATEAKGDGGKSKKAKSNPKTKKDVCSESQNVGDTSEVLMDVPCHHFIKKSLKFALKAVGVETAEERAVALKGCVMPMHRNAALAMLDTYAHKSLLRRITSMFLAHDKFQSGEVSVDVALELLGRCGIAHQHVENITLSVCIFSPKGHTPLLCVIQQMPLPGPPNATVEGEEPLPLQTQISEERVNVCSSAFRTGGTKLYWDDRNSSIYVGNRKVIQKITSPDLAKSIMVQLEALIHVCFVVEACIVEDQSSSAVLYNPLLAALLPATSGAGPGAKSILMENALVSVMNPVKHLQRLSAHRRLQEQYLTNGDEAILCDTLPERQRDVGGTVMEKLRRRVDWAPRPASDGVGFEETAPMNSNDVYYEVGLKKLRLSAPTPEGARCYCLVSARKTLGGTWMPAVDVPVASIKRSKKGGFKWTFACDTNERVLFAGNVADTICIEACYDVEEGDGETATWCAGHVLVACSNAKSGKLSVVGGSLLSDVTPPAPSPKFVHPSKGSWCFWKKKKTATPATSILIVVNGVQPKSLPVRASLPPSFLMFRRHVSLMSQLRDAMLSVGGSRMTPLQVLRQQQVQNCLTVMVSPTLMDLMQVLWDRKLKGKMGAKPKDLSQRQRALLSLASTIISVHNSTAGDSDGIVSIVGRGTAIAAPINPLAPQCPVEV